MEDGKMEMEDGRMEDGDGGWEDGGRGGTEARGACRNQRNLLRVCGPLSAGVYLGPWGRLVPTAASDLPRNLLVLLRPSGSGTASSLFSSELEPGEAAAGAPCRCSPHDGRRPWHARLPADPRLWLKAAEAMHSAAVWSQAHSSCAHRLRPTPGRQEQRSGGDGGTRPA